MKGVGKMGKWSMGLSFWAKYLLTLPFMLLLYIPYVFIRLISRGKSKDYAILISKKTNTIDKWIMK